MEPARQQSNDLMINSTMSRNKNNTAVQKAQRDRLGLIKAPSKNENQRMGRSNRWVGAKQPRTKIRFHYWDSKERERMNVDDYYFPKPVVVRVRDLTPE